MPKNKFNQRRPTQEEMDAMENYFKPLRPQPKPPADGMGLEDEMLKPGKEYMKKGGMTKPVKTKIIKAQMGKYAGEIAKNTYKNYLDQKEEDRIKQRDQAQEDLYRKKIEEYQARYRMPMQTLDELGMEQPIERKKGGVMKQTKSQKKIGKVMIS